MQTLLIILLAIVSFTTKAQSKYTVYYEAEFLKDEIVQDYYKIGSSKTISSLVFGIDVKIEVDTIFKKYTILFTDKNNEYKKMIFNYERNIFLDDKEKNPKINKIYLMEFLGEHYCLIDYMDFAPLRMLEISFEKMYSNNCKRVFNITNVKKVIK